MAFLPSFSLQKGLFPASRGKNCMSQWVDNRGSLISAPLALREKKAFSADFVLISKIRSHSARSDLKTECSLRWGEEPTPTPISTTLKTHTPQIWG